MKIHSRYIADLADVRTQRELWTHVQTAIELEHATIPPYLCGYFTIKQGSNKEASDIIRSVVIEEMLHLSIASNLLLALGGSPNINGANFVPTYPHDLPMGIGDHHLVHLRKCSVEQVEKVFMMIEEPEEPRAIPVSNLKTAALAAEQEFDTIGAFYAALADKIVELGSDITWHTDKQNVASRWFPNPEEMFLIDSVEKAKAAITVIVNQGEGADLGQDPFDMEGAPAHYYRFEQIVKGKKLIVNPPGQTPRYVYGGAPVTLDMNEVWDMDDDPKVANYKPGSDSYRLATQFNYSYTKLLNAIHRAFNGEPEYIAHAMGVMYELRFLAQQTLATKAEWADPSNESHKQTGLSFEYQPINI